VSAEALPRGMARATKIESWVAVRSSIVRQVIGRMSIGRADIVYRNLYREESRTGSSKGSVYE
jgi:hypothetical protein